MKSRFLLASVFACGLALSAYGQEATTKNASPPATAPAATAIAITANSTPADLAKAALQAQGGDKFRNMPLMASSNTRSGRLAIISRAVVSRSPPGYRV